MIGFKVIHRARVHEARDVAEAGSLVASFYPEPSRLRVCETLTSDRLPNSSENLAVADAAARTLAREGRI